jgi:hypothetical protein
VLWHWLSEWEVFSGKVKKGNRDENPRKNSTGCTVRAVRRLRLRLRLGSGFPFPPLRTITCASEN